MILAYPCTVPVRRCRLGLAVLVIGVFFVVSMGSPTALEAQGVSTAAAAGRITDADGLPLAGARVEIRHTDTGATTVVLTAGDGRFYLPNLRPGGPYVLTVGKIGYAAVTREALSLPLGQVLQLDLVLQTEAVGLPELAVEIQADPEFNPARMGASTLIDQETVASFPTLTRNFVELATLSPMVKVSEEGVSVAGANLRYNNIQVDGALNQDVFGLSPSGVVGGQANARIVPLEAVEQFQVLVAPYDVRQSGFTGGLLNAVTRSGTNQWQGAAFGYYRGEALVGGLEIDNVSYKPDNLDNLYLGATLGGPIKRDRVHFFSAFEFERRRAPPAGFHVGQADPARTRLAPDSAARMESILQGYGADPGTAGVYTLENQLANVFARLDFQLGEAHDGMLRYNFAGAVDDPPANRLPGDAYEFSSVGTETETKNHSVLFQLLSSVSSQVSNDLLVNLQWIRENETPLADYSRIETTVRSDIDGRTLEQTVRSGADVFAHANELDQDILQITDNLTWATGQHRFLGGVSFQRFGIRRLFLPGSLGSYQFGSLGALEANTPTRYDITVPVEGSTDPSTRFSVYELSAYVQDEWAPTDWLNLRLGVRVDVPLIPGQPSYNEAVEEDFGVNTSQMPSGNPLFSPRFGFNIRLGDELTTQIRGGAGLFTGRPPFAWLANAYQNTGLESTSLTCQESNAPIFDPTIPAPIQCVDGTGPESGIPTVNAFDPNFKFPQDFKISLGVDQRLPLGFVASVEGVFTRAVNQIFLQDLNIGDPVPEEDRVDENGYSNGFGFGTREAFGEPTVTGFAPRRQSDRFGQVVWMTNREDNFAYAVMAQVTRRFADRYSVLAGYSYSRSADTQSLISSDATTNFGLTPVEGDPNDPKRQASLFDRPHKVVLSGSARFLENLGGTEVTLVYTGQSGAPYSYVYLGDVNGDGYAGDGRTLDLTNDLIYVSEAGFDFPDGLSALMFQDLVSKEKCLQDNQLAVLHRNACRAPWSDKLDFRLSQNIRAGSANIQIIFDILNVLNLVNRDWGLVQVVNPAVQVLKVKGRRGSGLFPQPTDPMVVAYNGPLYRTDQGGFATATPAVPFVPDSQWQMQLGLRVSF
jgi:hypothetical protein